MTIEQPIFPLTLAAFSAALRKGQGRALQQVTNYGPVTLEDEIIDNCLHCRSYDPQCEAARAPWLFTIVDRAGLKRKVIQAIGALVRDPPEQDHRDLAQRSAILKELAADGEDDARRLLYLSLARMSDTADVIADADIVALDGLDGLVKVARQVGRWLQEDPDFWICESLIEQIDESAGSIVGLAALEREAATDPDIAQYLIGLRQTRESQNAASGRPIETAFTGAQIVAHAKKEKSGKCHWFRRWAIHAIVDQREIVFAALLAEQTPEHVGRLLRCFGKIGVPQYDARILPWLFCTDMEVRWAAVQAVAQLSHFELRKAALRLIAEGDVTNGVRLLAANFESEDWSMCARRLEPSDDAEHHHSLGTHLLELCAAHPYPEALDCLLYVYEFSPCPTCRRRAVSAMIAIGIAPTWLLEESSFDADPETRTLASTAIAAVT